MNQFRVLCITWATLMLATPAFIHAASSPDPGLGQSIAGSSQPSDKHSIHLRPTLLDADGKPLSGVHEITFNIRAGADTSGELLWKETLSVQADENGRYVVDLGSSSPDFAERVLEHHSLVYVTTSSSPSTQETAAVPITTTPQGVFQSCNVDGSTGEESVSANCYGLPGETAETQLQTIAAANFTVVLNYSAFWGSQAQILAYAAEANTLGLKIIWPFGDPAFAQYVGTTTGKNAGYLISDYSEVGPDCNCTTNPQFITYLVNLVKDLPATYGYQTGDEPNDTSTVETDTHNLYNLIHSLDTTHPQLIAATWTNAEQPTLSNLKAYLDPFSFADLLGADYYPVGTGAPASDEATAAADLTTIANNYGKPDYVDLQAYSWETYEPSACVSASVCVFPTSSQLQTMLTDAVTDADPQLLLWYTYPDAAVVGNWTTFVNAVNPQK
ncbi:hypothetical protein [Granulicella sp. S156]|jgi:hypothetical protein|uniref:hypothetical protein n=1 Tax=Granulicella sp. S156 TaxID=1747224 RepID=UPI00131D67F4|nr:hypothetical protein [Granulicella sp. S156]